MVPSFSGAAASGAQTSPSGFSCCGAGAVGMRASIVVAHGLSSCGSWALGQKLVVVACRPSCSAAWGIFPDQGLNPCILPWQVDSLSLIHCGKPCISFKHFFKIIVGCIGPSFLPLGFFLQLRRGGAALCCSARASHYYSLVAEHRL